MIGLGSDRASRRLRVRSEEEEDAEESLSSRLFRNSLYKPENFCAFGVFIIRLPAGFDLQAMVGVSRLTDGLRRG